MVNEILRPEAPPAVGRRANSLGLSACGRGCARRFPRISRLPVYRGYPYIEVKGLLTAAVARSGTGAGGPNDRAINE